MSLPFLVQMGFYFDSLGPTILAVLVMVSLSFILIISVTDFFSHKAI